MRGKRKHYFAIFFPSVAGVLLMSVGEGWCVSFIHHSAVTNFMHLQSTYAPDLQYLQSDGHLESSQTSAVKLFCGNSQRVRNVGYFSRRVPRASLAGY